MAAYDLTTGTVDKNYQVHNNNWSVLEKTLDFSKFTGSAAGAATDTAKIITLPVGFIVEDVFTVVLTPSTTSSSTFGVGDSGSSVYYLPNTTSATAAAGTVVKTGTGAASAFKDGTSVTTYSASTCKYYTAADALVVVLGTTAPANGLVKFIVRGTWAI